MQVDKHVQHILTVSGSSPDSFDEAVKNTIKGAWINHHEEFSRFVSYEVLKFEGLIDNDLSVLYQTTLAISAIHKAHEH